MTEPDIRTGLDRTLDDVDEIGCLIDRRGIGRCNASCRFFNGTNCFHVDHLIGRGNEHRSETRSVYNPVTIMPMAGDPLCWPWLLRAVDRVVAPSEGRPVPRTDPASPAAEPIGDYAALVRSVRRLRKDALAWRVHAARRGTADLALGLVIDHLALILMVHGGGDGA